MNTIVKKILSFALNDTGQISKKQDNLEIISCPLKEMLCSVHLNVIKKNFVKSELYRKDKDYAKSIDALQLAFYKATEMMERPCNKCAHQYLLGIQRKMVAVHDELEEITKGFFGDKNYLPVFLKAGHVLMEFKNTKYSESIQLKEANIRFLGNFLN